MNIFSSVKNLLLRHIQDLEDHKSDFVRDPSRDFTRNRKLSFSDTIQMLISMECGSIRSELLKYFHFSPDTATASAFIQQRDKIKADALKFLFYSFSTELSSKEHKGYHLFAVDGSEVWLPMEGNDEVYGYFHRKDQRCYHQIHLNAVYDLLGDRYAAAYLEPRKGHNERNAFHQLFEENAFPEKSLFIFDRGYEGYPLMAHISAKGNSFIIRAKDNRQGGILKGFDLPAEEEFDVLIEKIFVNKIRVEHSDAPALYHRVHATYTPYFLNKSVKEYPLAFRIVRFRLDNGSYECLLTNLPEEEFDASALKELYRMRWGIETSFRQLKHSIGLSTFHSKKAESIELEIWARLILYNYCMAVAQGICKRENHSQYACRLNIANAIYVCRRFLKSDVNEAPPDIEKLISGELLPIRPDRTSPRKKTTQRPRKFNYRVL